MKTKSRKREAKAVAKRPAETKPAFAYDERRPIIAEALREAGRSLTVDEIYKLVKSRQIATRRRIAATFRFDQRSDSPMFERDGEHGIALRKRTRAAKTAKRARVSKRATKRAA